MSRRAALRDIVKAIACAGGMSSYDPGGPVTDPLSSWHDGVAKDAVVSFVHQVCGEGDTPPVPVAERVAVFDNDGTRAERALERAEKAGWTTVSIKDDWATVF